ncbi:TetR family transcriptional regulator [Streptomyces sp. TBY4]|uniref:TetR family transcriptional regulator n=1 Tax=Streptomyces sp. TBY4 TaxID=2962030 RepID=UPI0020B70BFB|nr:TetR family transcriptional regulator [Streptomyces sp. TBY4]MCP3756996.1 TetR family transcriptional regulator [Streptomyces sp. TBY4]
MPYRRPPAVQARLDARQELVLEAAIRLLSREGYAGCSVAAIAAEAGISGTAAQRVAAATEVVATRALHAPRRAFALLAEPADPAVDTERLVFRRAFRDVYARAIAAGVAAGELPPQSPELTAAALVGAIDEALVGPLADGDAASGGVVSALITFTLRALGGHVVADA